MAEGEASVGVGIALADQFGVQHFAVVEIGIGEGATVFIFVPALGVYFVENQSDGFPFDGIAGELLSVFAEALDSFFRMYGFRRVDADQAHFFVRTNDNCVAVDDADDFSKFAGLSAGFV